MTHLSTEGKHLPLEGIKVVETAQGVSGPGCGRILAGMGAVVIKIEAPLNLQDCS